MKQITWFAVGVVIGLAVAEIVRRADDRAEVQMTRADVEACLEGRDDWSAFDDALEALSGGES